MSYTVLARRYRATTFGGVIGQGPIAMTLQNAIAAGRVAHAYLFTGTRGVGKTSMARIFARALNAPATIEDCPDPAGHESYADVKIQQRMAEAIMRGEDLNVIEIDGASNNSVDQARQIIANAGLVPTGNARFKIYIIDEVHMLTTHAFNALLKTMEEPPPHVKFILCTTEPHKVLATIQSRCQRFDFRNIPTPSIAEHLRDVLEKEKIQAEDEVVWQLARLANGSMRDALSLLDRIIATSEQGVTVDLLEQMLGLPPQDLIVQLVDALAGGDVTATLRHTASLLDRGIAQEQLVDVLIERLRQLMLIGACGVESELVELSDEARTAAAGQAAKFEIVALVHMIALCENLQRHAKASSSPRALLDATVVRLALAEKMADVTAILAGDAAAPADSPTKKKIVKPPPPPINLPATELTSPPATAADTHRIRSRPQNAAPVSDPAPSDRDTVWNAVLASVADKPSLSWVKKLHLVALDNQVAEISLSTENRDLLSFVGQQRQRLADLFKSVLDRRVRIEIAGPDANSHPVSVTPPPDAMGNADDHVDQQTAMSLPLVRQVFEHFDATLIDARSQKS